MLVHVVIMYRMCRLLGMFVARVLPFWLFGSFN